MYVADKEPLDYGSGDGRREETPAWSNNRYYLDRKSFLKDIADQLWELFTAMEISPISG